MVTSIAHLITICRITRRTLNWDDFLPTDDAPPSDLASLRCPSLAFDWPTTDSFAIFNHKKILRRAIFKRHYSRFGLSGPGFEQVNKLLIVIDNVL